MHVVPRNISKVMLSLHWKNYIPVYCEITIFGWAMTFHKSRRSDEPQIKMSKNINSICIVQWFKTQSTKLMLNVHEYLYWRTTKCYAHVKKWLNSIQSCTHESLIACTVWWLCLFWWCCVAWGWLWFYFLCCLNV